LRLLRFHPLIGTRKKRGGKGEGDDRKDKKISREDGET